MMIWYSFNKLFYVKKSDCVYRVESIKVEVEIENKTIQMELNTGA